MDPKSAFPKTFGWFVRQEAHESVRITAPLFFPTRQLQAQDGKSLTAEPRRQEPGCPDGRDHEKGHPPIRNTHIRPFVYKK